MYYAWLYLYVFGFLTIAGGVIGFLKAKSKASLIAGGTAGVLLLVAAYLAGSSGRNGMYLGLAVSLMLAVRFIKVFASSRKVMPAGLMAVLSVVGVGMTGYALFG